MSWSVTLSDVAVADVEETARKMYAEQAARAAVPATVEMDEQFEAALAAARSLYSAVREQGTVLPGGVNVVLTGHANPGHNPQPGWANDHVSVSVSDSRVHAKTAS